MNLTRLYALGCRMLGHAWTSGAQVHDEDARGPYTIAMKTCRRCGVVVRARVYDDGAKVEIIGRRS